MIYKLILIAVNYLFRSRSLINLKIFHLAVWRVKSLCAKFPIQYLDFLTKIFAKVFSCCNRFRCYCPLNYFNPKFTSFLLFFTIT